MVGELFIVVSVGNWFILQTVKIQAGNIVKNVMIKKLKKLKMNTIEELGQTSSFLLSSCFWRMSGQPVKRNSPRRLLRFQPPFSAKIYMDI